MRSNETSLTRRSVMRAGIGGAVSLAAPQPSAAAGDKPHWVTDPFTLGVASGAPHANGVVLWTRLAPAPLQPDGGLPPQDLVVQWQVAEDMAFARIVRRGETIARASNVHSVHVDVRGLRPDRWYFYRFKCGKAISRVGRTRTLPAHDARVSEVRLAIASCQRYEHGYYTAYRHMVEQAPDLIVHLGDYIYENTLFGPRLPDIPTGLRGTATDLTSYRLRHTLYRLDPNLQDAHACAPWLLIPDNHDAVEDGDTSQQILSRRAAAYQAYYEHLPLPRGSRPHGPSMHIYHNVDYGTLLRLHLLDTRQYRDEQAICGAMTITGPGCSALEMENRSMLGAAQERWLHRSLRSSTSTWNAIAQTVLFAPYHFKSTTGVDRDVYYGSWNGYPAARRRLLEDIRTLHPQNPLTLSGDWHTSWVNHIPSNTENLGSRTVMSEFLTTGVSSDPTFTSNITKPTLKDNPQVVYYAEHCGYTLCSITSRSWQTTFHAAQTLTPDGTVAPRSSWTIESGNPEANAS